MTRCQRGIAAATIVAAALARACFVEPRALWRDGVILLALYAAFTVVARQSRAWRPVTTVLVSFLLGLYVFGQFPYTLNVLGLGR